MTALMAATAWLQAHRPHLRLDEDAVRAGAGRSGPPAPPSRVLRRTSDVIEETVAGLPVVTLVPRGSAARGRLLYLHGGCYVAELVPEHWWIIRRLMRATGFTVTVPSYGLAPAHDVDDAYPFLDAVVARMREHDAAGAEGPLLLAGDSAGGGLAAGMAQRLRDAGAPADGVVLVSPWLDAAMTNPAIAEVAPRDPSLDVATFAACGRVWAGERGVADPLVSPVRGDLAGLPPTLVLQGGRDILAPDAELFVERARAAGSPAELLLAPAGFHDHVGAVWTAEAREAYARVESFSRRLRP